MEREEEDDVVCLDESFFINDNYQLTTFKFGSQVLELYCLQSATTDFDLTGQMVWPGAELMNDYLSKNYDMLRGCSVIELGSGVGITGILCSRYCSEVIMTDHNDEVLKILTRNIELQNSSKGSVCSAKLKSEKVEWGNSEQLNHILQSHPEGFDLVLGADIYILIYTIHLLVAAFSFLHIVFCQYLTCLQQSNIPFLFDTVERLLHASHKRNGRFILAYVSRIKAIDEMVIRDASRRGLHVSEVAGTRTAIRGLGGVIYEITCA